MMYLDDIGYDLSVKLANNVSIFSKNEGTVTSLYNISASRVSPIDHTLPYQCFKPYMQSELSDILDEY